MSRDEPYVFKDVPLFFQGCFRDASLNCAETYDHAGSQLQRYLHVFWPCDAADNGWPAECERLTQLILKNDENDRDAVIDWFVRHFPGCMALVPKRWRHSFFKGALYLAQLFSAFPPSEETRQDEDLTMLDWAWGNVKRLARAQLQVERRYSECTTPHRLYPRQCFPEAVRYVENHGIRDMWLLLGESMSGGHDRHFWVELPGGILFDGVLQRFYDREMYYKLDHTRPWYKFTKNAVRWILKQSVEKYGWDSDLGLPWADGVNPWPITGKLAREYLEKKRQGLPRDFSVLNRKSSVNSASGKAPAKSTRGRKRPPATPRRG